MSAAKDGAIIALFKSQFENAHANARLTAGAPGLLKAAKLAAIYALQAGAFDQPWWKKERAAGELRAAWEVLEEAVMHATGLTPLGFTVESVKKAGLDPMKNPSQHSPEPWPRPKKSLEPYREAAYSMRKDVDPADDEARANANLMSAAPVLLDKLESLVAIGEILVRTPRFENEFGTAFKDLNTRVIAARRAIAEARGD